MAFPQGSWYVILKSPVIDTSDAHPCWWRSATYMRRLQAIERLLASSMCTGEASPAMSTNDVCVEDLDR